MTSDNGKPPSRMSLEERLKAAEQRARERDQAKPPPAESEQGKSKRDTQPRPPVRAKREEPPTPSAAPPILDPKPAPRPSLKPPRESAKDTAPEPKAAPKRPARAAEPEPAPSRPRKARGAPYAPSFPAEPEREPGRAGNVLLRRAAMGAGRVAYSGTRMGVLWLARRLRQRQTWPWLLGVCLLLIVGGALLRTASIQSGSLGLIAPLFTREVRYWERNLAAWADTYDVDANLLATLMQIESCGWPDAESSAGAQGLFQVMPFHFSPGESMTEPNTNARRGAGVIADCLIRADGDAGLAMACYNGGPRLINLPMSSWPNETQRYYRWGTGIYSDARAFASRSQTLESWLTAGGASLCERAARSLNLAPATAPPADLPTPGGMFR